MWFIWMFWFGVAILCKELELINFEVFVCFCWDLNIKSCCVCWVIMMFFCIIFFCELFFCFIVINDICRYFCNLIWFWIVWWLLVWIFVIFGIIKMVVLLNRKLKWFIVNCRFILIMFWKCWYVIICLMLFMIMMKRI